MKGTFLFVAVVFLLSVVEAKKEKSNGWGRPCNWLCFKMQQPLCASDGKTYNNMCLFNKAKCEANKTGVSLEIKYTGPCRCSEGLADCDQAGNSTKRAVCGSDNTTYASFCFFRVARCEAKRNNSELTVLYKGECGQPKEAAKKPGMCPVVNQCGNKEQPVCGSDKKTYRNTCFFLVAKCTAKRQNKKLTIKKKGACGNRRPSKPCPKKCPPNNRPVCGTDNKTYQNGCRLAKAKCALPKKDRGSLQLQYNGPCGAPVTPKPCPRWEDCKVVNKPVCGSDGKTYPNVCRFRVAMCHARRNKHKPLKLKYREACKKRRNRKERRKGKKDSKGKKNGKGKSGSKGNKNRRD